MNFGVIIEKGAVPWQIFQMRKDQTAAIHLEGKCFAVQLSKELPLVFSSAEAKNVTVRARIALENSGESVIPWTKCQVTENKNWQITFPCVPAGGLYRIETCMDYEGWDGLSCTRGDVVQHIGVGDVFVIAGQSNAAGRSKNPVEDEPDLYVHVLKSSGQWDLASHPLGDTTNAVHTGHYENHNPGHSPWLHFGKIIRKNVGYPIGLVPCAYGGAPLRWWNPGENGALFHNMLEMLGEYHLHPKGVLWYQGEAEGFEESAYSYLKRFSDFVNAVRRAFQDEELPFITVQLGRFAEDHGEKMDRQWGMVRESQRQAMHQIKHLAVVPANDLSLYDFIHLSSQSNLVVGERCARAALSLCYGKERDWMAPEADRAVRISEDTVRVHFLRIRSWINPYEVPACRLPFEAEDQKGLIKVKSYVTEQDTLTLTFERKMGVHSRLHGAWRADCGAFIPFDCMRMPMLSFYGLPIEEEKV